MSTALEDNPNQKLILVDAKGKPTGKILDRKTCHIAPGIKHLAIQVLVFNPKNELVLHERPTKKVGGGVLDAPTTHVLYGETPWKAAMRCLKEEYGIAKADVEVLDGFSYEKDYGDGSCENEFCLAAYTVFSGTIRPNTEHAGKIANVAAKKVAAELKTNPAKYPIWFKETVRIVLKSVKNKFS